MRLSTYILITILTAFCIIMIYQNKQIKELKLSQGLTGGDIAKAQTIDSLQHRCDSLQYLADSLYNENFPCQIELGRYQVAYQIFLERNRKAAEQYGTIISNETE